MDLGMYLSEVMLSNVSNIEWRQPIDNKRFADYGHLVLSELGPVPINPVRIAVTLAYAIANGKQRGRRLKELYEYWSNQGGKLRTS
jgi:hypothetical protein